MNSTTPAMHRFTPHRRRPCARHSSGAVYLALAWALLLNACGGDPTTPPPPAPPPPPPPVAPPPPSGPAPAPAPVVSQLSPSVVSAESDGFVLTVTGSGFVTASTIAWNGVARTTTFVSATELTTAVLATDVESEGSAAVTVSTPTPGGGTSDSLTFKVEPAPVAVVEVAAVDSLLVPAQTAQLVASTRSAKGTLLSDRTLSWRTSDSTIAVVDTTGMVTAVSPGVATISAVSNGVNASVQFDVVPGGVVTASGGTVAHSNLALVFAAGAVDTTTIITVASVSELPDTTNVIAGTAWRFQPAGRTFSAPVTVRLSYASDALHAGMSKDELLVHRWDGQSWMVLENASADTAANITEARTFNSGLFAVVRVLKAPAVPEWQRVTGHPGEAWADRWGDWTVAAGRLWVVENEPYGDRSPQIHWSEDGISWQSIDARSLGLPTQPNTSVAWCCNSTLVTGTENEIVIVKNLITEGSNLATGTIRKSAPWVVRGTPGNFTVQGPANAPGLDPARIPSNGQYSFGILGMSGGKAAWGDRVVLLARATWWYPFATTDQSFLSLTSGAEKTWQMFARRAAPWGAGSFQWITAAAGTPWGFFAVGHIGLDTKFWFSADGQNWNVADDPVGAFGGSRDDNSKVWSGTMMYGKHGLVMARVRDTPSAQIAAWRTDDGKTWRESVISDETYGDPRGFVAGEHYIVAAPDTSRVNSRLLRYVWVSLDAQEWVRIPEGPRFTQIIGWRGRLWGFRSGEVWELDISGVGGKKK